MKKKKTDEMGKVKARTFEILQITVHTYKSGRLVHCGTLTHPKSVSRVQGPS